MKKTSQLFSTIAIAALALVMVVIACKKKDGGSPNVHPVVPPPVTTVSDMQLYMTTPNQLSLFQKQNVSLVFATGTTSYPVIDVDTTQTYQTIDGFGY
ncbi:MAG: glucosylceramidase, partial [Chitinophagaceae bacterium]